MLGRKGQSEWNEVITLIFVSVAIMMIVFALPQIIEKITSLFALGSAEAVARDLGGLVTISGAAIDRASITYTGADQNIVYNVEISGKVVSVEAFKLSDGKLESIGNIAALKHGYSRIPFDVSASIGAANAFLITKSLFDDGRNYNIQVR